MFFDTHDTILYGVYINVIMTCEKNLIVVKTQVNAKFIIIIISIITWELENKKKKFKPLKTSVRIVVLRRSVIVVKL